MIAFLTGAGRLGKNEIINNVQVYCKTLCDNLKLKFNSKTNVVTAMSGSIAGAINRETPHNTI